jgi:hypothetical protein
MPPFFESIGKIVKRKTFVMAGYDPPRTPRLDSIHVNDPDVGNNIWRFAATSLVNGATRVIVPQTKLSK